MIDFKNYVYQNHLGTFQLNWKNWDKDLEHHTLVTERGQKKRRLPNRIKVGNLFQFGCFKIFVSFLKCSRSWLISFCSTRFPQGGW